MTDRPTLDDLFGTDDFVGRHIGPDGADRHHMLGVLGVDTIDELLAQTVPASIRMDGDLQLPAPRSVADVLGELRALADQNRPRVSMIGMGYSGTITPPVIARNVLENPAWYTAYTPYQPEISQGRLEALLNFQTMVSELTGFDLAQSRNALPNVVADRTRQSDIDWLFTLTPRIGYAVDRWLVYIKGGYANAEVFRGTTVSSTSFQLTGTNRREDGWTIGTGFEVAMASWVTLGLDYSYVNIDPKARPGTPQFLAANVTAGTATTSDAEIHLLTARLNFKVGGL